MRRHLPKAHNPREQKNIQELSSPFMLQLKCYSALTDLDVAIIELGECENPTLKELYEIRNAMSVIANRINAFINIQTQNITPKYTGRFQKNTGGFINA